MKHKLIFGLSLATIIAAVCGYFVWPNSTYAQTVNRILPSTAFTADLLTSADASAARTKLGTVASIGGSFTNITITGATLSGVITNSTLTQGSVMFAGASGILTQDNTNLFFDDSANILRVPTIVGNTSTTGDLTLQTTSGVGASGADMHFLVGNNGATEAITILNNGDVGMGTVSPGAKLEVAGNIFSKFSNAGNDTNGLYIINTQGNGYGGSINIQGSPDVLGTYTYSRLYSENTSGGGGFLAIQTANTSQALATRMYFDDAGNVGIGTTAPLAKLAVNGGANIGADADPGDNNLNVVGLTTTGTLAVGGGTTITSLLTATATLDFASVPANSTADLTITVTGAAANDIATVGPPVAPDAGISFFAFVSAADTVTIRCINSTTGAIDPASATYRASVIHY